MNEGQHIEVKTLSPALQAALKSVRYGATDIRVIAAETVSSYSEGNQGSRGFAMSVNLETGATRSMVGQWGGGNPFVSSPIDSGDEQITLPPHGAVVKGTLGYPRTFATIYAHPTAVGAFLLPSGAPEEELTDAEQQAIYCFAAIKGGEYRRDEMRRRRVTPDVVDALVSRGYLKRNRAGATQITTKGKNARTVRH